MFIIVYDTWNSRQNRRVKVCVNAPNGSLAEKLVLDSEPEKNKKIISCECLEDDAVVFLSENLNG